MIYIQLIFSFLKIGLFTIGGGYAMIPLIQSEVISNAWISAQDLINYIAISQSLPGPFAINISTYVGIVTGGYLGAVISAFASVLPSFVIILFIAKHYEKFSKSLIVNGAMQGLRPAAIGLIGSALISISKTFINSTKSYNLLLIALGIYIFLMILQIKKVHPFFIILISAVSGIIVGTVFKAPL